MKLLIISDTHGDVSLIKACLDLSSYDGIIHLGDHAADLKALGLKPQVHQLAVSGNCDFNGDEEAILEVAGKKLLLCHGHRYGVKDHTKGLFWRAVAVGAHVALFGHTHRAYEKEREGILLLNPGSATYPKNDDEPTVLELDITEAGIRRKWLILSAEKLPLKKG